MTEPTSPNAATPNMPLVNVDLDDHRFQPGSLPRTEGSGTRTRRSTAASIPQFGQTDFLDLPASDSAIRSQLSMTEGFEEAIIEDNASMRSNLGVDSPAATRNMNRRGSSRSRRLSVSPATSVQAFAESRRHRSNTNAANDNRTGLELLPLTHTPSHDGISHRRLTFSETPGIVTRDDNSSSAPSSIENDVCYPQESHPPEGPLIDFEELEEYVAEAELGAGSGDEKESINQPAETVPPVAKPDEDAFDELERIKLAESDSSRVQQDNVPSPMYTFFTTKSEEAVHATSLGGLLEEGETFKGMFSVQTGDDGCWWLDVVRPSEDDVSVLCKAFGVHPLTREDITMSESREKVELFRHYYFVAFHSFSNDKNDKENYLEPVHIYAVVFRQGILTFSHTAHAHMGNVLRRIGRLRDYMRISSDWICYAMIDDIVDGFQPVIREVDREVDVIEDGVFLARETDARTVLVAIGECRRKVMSILRLLGGKSDVIKGFAKRCNEQFSVAPTSDVGMYLSDIQDHVISHRETVIHWEQLLSRVHTNFLSSVNIENIEGGNRINKTLGKVTLFATIIVPLNLVTGLFGMNVPVPGKDSESVAWFFGILGCMLAFAVVGMAIARRMGMI